MEWSGKVSEERTFDLRTESEGISHVKLGRAFWTEENAQAKGLKREQVGFFKRKEANDMGRVCPKGGGSSGRDNVSEAGKLDEAGPWGSW